jgi:adenosine 3'-phospho 5'-phosphosulfate transporter B2
MAEGTPERKSALESAAWCCFYGAGIIGMLVIYGLLQERIMSIPYGDPPVLFQDSVFLVFCNRAVAVVFACFMVGLKGESYANAAPFWKYLAISFSNVYASTCQYEALKYVSFPVQMLGKSFKMMPVMVWGMLVSGKRFGLSDWLIAFAVTGGVVEFLMTGPISSHSDQGSSTYGLMLLAGFLALDGFTSTFQEKLFKEHTTSKYNQMLYINLGSCIISSFTLFASGRINDAVGFAMAHPAFVQDSMSLSAAAVAGQWFIYSQVKEFGAVVFAAPMNVRQVVSILISYAKYGHSITVLQIFGLAIIFGALFYKSFSGLLASSDEKKPLLEKKEGKEAANAPEAAPAAKV